MCELFGESSKGKIRPSLMLKEFFLHGIDNPHGWGAAFFCGGKANVVKEPVSAAESGKAKDFAEDMPETDLLIAHIRFATKGQVMIENTHPFAMKDNSGCEWVLAHNGTIFASDLLSGYIHKQNGETDSERLLMYLIDRLNEKLNDRISDSRYEAAGSLTANERIRTVEKVIKDIAPDNKLNLLISDGRLLYAHTNYRGSLNVLNESDAVVISSRPLDAGHADTVQRDDPCSSGERASGWEELPLNTLMVYEEGCLIYRGTPHDSEYFEDEERTRALFLDYAYM